MPVSYATMDIKRYIYNEKTKNNIRNNKRIKLYKHIDTHLYKFAVTCDFSTIISDNSLKRWLRIDGIKVKKHSLYTTLTQFWFMWKQFRKNTRAHTPMHVYWRATTSYLLNFLIRQLVKQMNVNVSYNTCTRWAYIHSINV